MGIDPGTTTGIAVFDLDGKLMLLKSRKDFSMSRISSFLSEIGEPVIIASDITSRPRTIEKIASTFSAGLMVPEEVLSRRVKSRMAKEYLKKSKKKRLWGNRHERDAMVAALHAWKRLRPRTRKIDERLKKYGISRELSQRVKANVILMGDNVSVSVKKILRQHAGKQLSPYRMKKLRAELEERAG